MSASERTRKILWAKAGGRCSICRVLLVTEGTETDDPSVFGQEAHIISEKTDGPRHAYLPNFDVYSNIMLLCSKHHKQVDDQVGHYTVDLLKQIKRDHEAWVARLDDGPIRIVADPGHPAPKMLTLCMTASSLWNLMPGTHQSRPSWPAGLTDEQEDLIAEFLDNLNDWRDVDSMENTNRIRREAIKDLQGYITELQELGLLIGARVRRCLLTGGSQPPEPWRIIDIEIQPLSIAQLVDEE